MNKEIIEIRELQSGDIPDAMQLVYSEKWNQTEKDWTIFISNKNNVCLAATIAGKIVATATAINYLNQVAWIGMVLVNKQFRGRGISKLLLNALFKKLRSCKTIKLDATPAGEFVYKKMDFVPEYEISRMVCRSFTFEVDTDLDADFKQITNGNIDEIVAFDRAVFGAGRDELIRKLVANNPENSWLIRENSTLSGFVLGREGNRFYQMGPLSATTENSARLLTLKALKNLSGKPVVVDIPDEKIELIEWLISVGFEKRRHFTRMYLNGNSSAENIDFQYLICGPEFG